MPRPSQAMKENLKNISGFFCFTTINLNIISGVTGWIGC
jgi:hypothetical protein